MRTTIIAAIEKEIVYSRQTRDYDLFITIDNQREYIGSAPNHHEAEERCNAYVFQYLTDTHTHETAAELLMQEAA